MASDDFRRHDLRYRADAVRLIPLEVVLTRWGALRERRDKSQWRTEHGPLSVTGPQFFNWHLHEGGGGAIDLVMHLGKMDYRAAVQWLEQRCLATAILEPLIDVGKVYADERGNAVFLMVAGKANRAIGAELRGTGPRPWRGLVPGTCKDTGYFWIGTGASQKIVVCESAIDAISCFQLHSMCICISTAGVRSDAPWLHPLLARGYDIYCGFDDDKPGNAASSQMITHHPSIKRLRPTAHDWNDALAATR